MEQRHNGSNKKHMRGASMMRNNKKSGGMKHRHGGNNRRYNNHGGNGGNNRQSEHQNLARQKHHASQMRDKFQTLARDAQMSGERVEAEYYLQHVDHYMRVLADIATIEAERFAHQREQQAASGEGDAESAEGSEATGEANAEGAEGDAAHAAPRQQDRSRHQRGPRNRRPQENAEANSEPNPNDPRGPREIPLPASILSEIPASQ